MQRGMFLGISLLSHKICPLPGHVLVPDMMKKYNKLEDNTCHITNDPTGVYDIIEINETTIIGDGNGLKITRKGKLDVIVELI